MFQSIPKTILSNYYLKKIAIKVLSTNRIVNSFPYQFIYRKKINFIIKKYANKPKSVNIENTSFCNSNCSFCPHDIMKRKKGTMGMELFKKIINQIAEHEINYIDIHGFGEPLLDKKFFEKVRYAHKKGVKNIRTNTNGQLLLGKNNIDNLLSSGINQIFISFDAFSHETYKKIRPSLNFHIVNNGIETLVYEKKKRGLKKPEIILSFIECELNKKEVKKYLNYWKKKVDFIYVSPLITWPDGKERYKEEEKMFFRDPCKLIFTEMQISWTGEVVLCCKDYENEEIIGDLKKQKLINIWQGEKLNKLRKIHLEKKFLKIPICKKCSLNRHNKLSWWHEG